MNLAELCIRRPVMVTLLTLSAALAGLVAYQRIPVAALPSYSAPVINVEASLAGASPDTMASSVALPLEKEFSTIAGTAVMTSTSSLGATSIALEFGPGTDINAAAADVQAALLRAQRALPRDMTELPSYRKTNPAEAPVLSMEMTSPSLSLSELNDYAENLIAPSLSSLPGVAQLRVLGQKRFAVRIRADLSKMQARDISMDELAQAVRAANANSPLGTLDGPQQSLIIAGNAQLLRAADFAGLIVATRAGMPVRLREVASVEDSYQSVRSASSLNGERSIVLSMSRQSDANTVEVVDAARRTLKQLQNQLPASVSITMINDRSVSIRAAMHDVNLTLGATVALVVLVIFLFLHRAAATLIPAVTIPLSLLVALLLLYAFGYSLDNVSLLGMTLAVGLVVDDAIVVLENIVRHSETGKPPLQAAIDGAREVSLTVVSISISLVAVFMPIFFLPGVIGLLFHEFAVVVSLAVLVSALLSLTLVPMLASKLPLERQALARLPRPSLRPAFERAFGRLSAAYAHSLQRALAHRRAVLLVGLSTLLLTVILYIDLPKGYLPDEDIDQVRVSTEAADDVSAAAMAALQEQLAAIIRRDPNVQDVTSSLSGDNTGSFFLLLKPRAQRASMPETLAGLRRATSTVPGIAAYFKPVQNFQVGARPSKSRYQYTLQSVSASALDQWAARFLERMRADPRFADVTSDASSGGLQATLEIDRDKAAMLGVTVADIRTALYSAFGERQAAAVYGAAATYTVLVEAAQHERQFDDALGRVAVRSKDGRLIQLAALASVTRTLGPLAIHHQGQLQAITISFNLAPGTALGSAVEAIAAIRHELQLPLSIVGKYGGEAAVFQDSQTSQLVLILGAVMLMYVVLGVLYESFLHPLTILAGLPSAALGALLTLKLFGLDLTMIAVVGILLLIGLVKKNAIMIVDVALHLQRDQDMGPAAAIEQACAMRFRPIMMTTMVALVGALPLALGLGAGAELRQPLGLAVVGGLLLSQLITLYLTPVLYLLLERAGAKRALDSPYFSSSTMATPQGASASEPALATLLPVSRSVPAPKA